MSLYLAIDAGGTKTDYVLADQTTELARVRGGTIKRLRTDAATAAGNLDTALVELAARSGADLRRIARICVGTAGETVPLVTDWLRAEIGARVPGDMILLGDVEIALDAAFFGQPGVLVLAGTGSNVAGRTATGGIVTAGGYGPALADQGSGYWIGHHALRAAFLALDEEQPTTLLQAILDFWRVPSIDLLVELANRTPPPDFSQLTTVVAKCAAEGDAVANAVLRRGARDLARLVALVVRRLQRESPGTLPPIAFAGSILHQVAPVREALIATLTAEFGPLHILEGVVDPIQGALWRARASV